MGGIIALAPERGTFPEVTHHRRIIEASGAPAAVGPYSHAVVSNGLVFCSGQVPLDADSGELVGDTAGEQAKKCLENLAAVAVAAGASLSDAVRCTVYLTDLAADWAEVDEAYAGFFGGDPPARAAIGVAQLPKNARVEIDAILALPD
jgi:2-iminobutanoate/2-iminopropanoate deaminase